MKLLFNKPKSILIGLILLIGVHAFAGSVDGKICFVQPQAPGLIREDQIVSFEALIGEVSSTNIRMHGESLDHYLRRMNEPLRSIYPSKFIEVENDINQLKGVFKAKELPILTDEYKKYYSSSNPCYVVPLAYTNTETNGAIRIVLGPFTNVKKLSTNLSAFEWFAIANVNQSFFPNYLAIRSSGFKNSPTAKIVLDRISAYSMEINFDMLKHLCTQQEFVENKLCKDVIMGKLIFDPKKFNKYYSSRILSKCIEEQDGVLSNQDKLEKCLTTEKENRTLGSSVKRSYKEIEAEIEKGGHHTFNGLFTLFALAPLHPVIWYKYDQDAQMELNSLSSDLTKLPVNDIFQLKNALIQKRPQMISQLYNESEKNIEFVLQSNLTQIQKSTLVSEQNELITSGIFFENVEITSDSFSKKIEDKYKEIFRKLGNQYIWP